MSYRNICDVILLNPNENKYVKFNKAFIYKPTINISSFNNDKFLLKNITKYGFEILNCSNSLMKLNYIAIQTNKNNKTEKIKNILLVNNSIDVLIESNDNDYSIDLNTLILEKNPYNENIIFEIYELPNDGNLIINNNNLTYTKNLEQTINFKIKAKLENYQDVFEIIDFNILLEVNPEIIVTQNILEDLQQYENYSIDLNTLILNKIPENENVVFEIYQQPNSGMLFVYNNLLNYTKDFNFSYGIINFKVKAKLENYQDVFEIIDFNLNYERQKSITLSNSYIIDSITNNNDYIFENLTSYIQEQYPENEQILIEIYNNAQNGSISLLNNNLIYSPDNTFTGTEYFTIKYYFENFPDVNSFISFSINVSEPVQQFQTIGNINFSTSSNSFTALQLKYNNNFTSNNTTAAFSIPSNDINNSNNYFSLDLLDNTNLTFYIFLSNARNQNLYYISDMNNIESSKIQKGPITYVQTYNSGALLQVLNKYYFWFNSSNNSWYYSDVRFPYL